MDYKIKEFNLHITEYCSGHCPMCYATDEKIPRKHGDLETLKLIVHNAIANGKVERFVMVGGDPCEHPNLVELLKYIKDEGKKFNVATKNMVISNTHAEYVNDEVIQNISSIYNKGIVEVGIGVESTNEIVREICHHKGINDLSIIKNAVDVLHKYNFKALAYINFKPIFLTEQEAIDDAIETAINCFKMGFDAISIEPTSLQDYSLANHLYQIGQYRVPWLWSIRDVVQGIYDKIGDKELDIRLGGYFDEEVLSGSQGAGFEEKNEIFPHMTSLNCSECSNDFIDCIKKFNMTYDIRELYNIKKCDKCYKIWKDVKRIRDSRNIVERVNDILGKF